MSIVVNVDTSFSARNQKRIGGRSRAIHRIFGSKIGVFARNRERGNDENSKSLCLCKQYVDDRFLISIRF